MDKLSLIQLRGAEQLITLKENNPRAIEKKIEELKEEIKSGQYPEYLKQIFLKNNIEILEDIEEKLLVASLEFSYQQYKFLLKGLLIFCEPIIREKKVLYQFKMIGLYSKERMCNEQLYESYYEGLAEMLKEAENFFEPFNKEAQP